MCSKLRLINTMAKSAFLQLMVTVVVTTLLSSDHVTGSETETAAPHSAAAPYNADDHPSGFWFGTQNLGCVMGISRRRRRRRGLSSPWRYTLATQHRLVYYRGLLFEWGTGAETYNVGMHPAVPECLISWEDSPAGESSCPMSSLEDFTRRYKTNYGSYNAITNNCHHYANRLVEAMASPTCSTQPSRWSQLATRFWRSLTQSRDVSRDQNTQSDLQREDQSDDVPIIN